jgi:hypothetical protein
MVQTSKRNQPGKKDSIVVKNNFSPNQNVSGLEYEDEDPSYKSSSVEGVRGHQFSERDNL